MDIYTASEIVSNIPELNAVEKIEFLDKGFSQDRKYVLWVDGKPEYLLRLTDTANRERNEKDFRLMSELHRQGVLCSEPFFLGANENSSMCYSIFSFISGDSAEEALPKLTEKQQFKAGLVSGEELRKMHQLPCPDASFNWYEHRKTKYLRIRAKALKLKLDYPGREKTERYIDRNLDLMRNVLSTFQHDDYHPGNMIIHNGEFAGVIDFNRSDWGDPYHDFFKIPQFTVLSSIPFSKGQIIGYFDNTIPDNFWKLYNLYVAINQPSSVVWANEFDKEGLEFFRWRIEETLATHDFENGGPPQWFDKQ